MKKMLKTTDLRTTSEVASESTILNVFSIWWRVVKTIFGKQKDNEVLEDLGVKKGFFSGVKYMMWLTFILPAQILLFFLSPKWIYLRFFERSVVTPLFEVSSISGEDSPSQILGGIYEKYLNHLASTQVNGVAQADIKPSTADIEKIVAFSKMRTVITMIAVSLGALFLYDELDEITDLISILIDFCVSGLTKIFGADLMTSFAGGTSAFVMAKVITFFLIAYLLMVFVSFLTEAFKNIAYTRKEMVQNFIDDVLNYTLAKSVENFGEDIAYEAYDLLLENLVIKENIKAYDDYGYDKLIEWKEQKQSKAIHYGVDLKKIKGF